MEDRSRLLQRLGHRFSDEALLERALSHRSRGADNNERLEFLGDGILNFIIADALYQRFPRAREGDLSRMRASLVKGKTLARLAREFALGDYLLLGPGELKSGGHRRESILADTVEALVGAIYLDADFATCSKCVQAWFAKYLDELSPNLSHKDAKTRLQEFLQARRQPLPVYHLEDTRGEAHQQEFEVSCEVSLLGARIAGRGSSRKAAEQAAAAATLDRLQGEQ